MSGAERGQLSQSAGAWLQRHGPAARPSRQEKHPSNLVSYSFLPRVQLRTNADPDGGARRRRRDGKHCSPAPTSNAAMHHCQQYRLVGCRAQCYSVPEASTNRRVVRTAVSHFFAKNGGCSETFIIWAVCCVCHSGCHEKG